MSEISSTIQGRFKTCQREFPILSASQSYEPPIETDRREAKFGPTQPEETAMKNIALIPALAVLVVSRYANAATDPGIGIPSETVHFADLDIAQISGAANLYQRLDLAANDVCKGLSRDLGRNLALWKPYHDCVRAALGRAVASVNAPALTALAAAHGIVTASPVQVARSN
jgi:UrcA family protein